MSNTLSKILNLVGTLDDAPGDDTPRQRFRNHLFDDVTEVGKVRDYVEECLRLSGDQYNKALQDLVIYIGQLLGFEPKFGIYRGKKGEIGFDGLWKSPSGYHIVVEVKTTDVYPIEPKDLDKYVDELMTKERLESRDNILGLYVIGRSDANLKRLESAIIQDKPINKLRVITVDSLLSIAEMMEYDIEHEDIISIIKPSKPIIDPIVDLMARLVAQEKIVSIDKKRTEEIPEGKEEKLSDIEEIKYWISPVASDEEYSAEKTIKTLVGEEKVYAFTEGTKHKKDIKPGDLICFYAQASGVVAHAKVASKPSKKQHPKVRNPDKYPWVFNLSNSVLYLKKAIVIDAELRAKLDYFEGKDPYKPWGWFVQATRKINKHDFELLTNG